MRQDHKVDLFVISVACHAAVNRKLYKLFVEDGISVAILLPNFLKLAGGTFLADPDDKSGCEIIFDNLLGSNSRVQLFRNQFKWLNIKRPKRILLDNDPISLNAVLIGIWCYFNNAKLSCLSCENLPIGILDNIRRKGFRSVFSSILKKILSKFSVYLVDIVFTINNEGTKIFIDEGFQKVIKIPLGFDPKIFYINPNARERIRNKLSVNNYLIGFFGRVTREKGIFVLLKALHEIKKLDWSLVMDEFIHYKTEFSEKVIQAVTHFGLQDKIIFVNPSHSEMGEYMNAVDLVVMPSIQTPSWVEQYGRIAPESMACGKLVIASRTGALPMLIDRFGILFSEGSVQELKLIIQNALGSKEMPIQDFNPKVVAEYAYENLSINKQKEIMFLSLFPCSKH